MRGDLSQAALATDLVLQASADQKTLSNNYQARCPLTLSAMRASAAEAADSAEAAAPGLRRQRLPRLRRQRLRGGGSGATNGTRGGLGTVDGGNQKRGIPGAAVVRMLDVVGPDRRGGLFAGLAGLVGLALLRARAKRKR